MAQRGEGISATESAVPALLPALERRLSLARAALFWERFWPALMPAGMVLAGFLIFAGFDIGRFLPVWLHWLALGLFAVAFLLALWLGLRTLRWPDRAAAMRRLELVNLLSHRPLEAVADRLAAEQQDPIARALWTLHRRRALERLAAIRVGMPQAGWWRRDVWGIRAALGLLLVVAWASPGEDRIERLADTISPGTALPLGMTLTMDAWITPPAYTGRAPIFLSRDGKPVMQASSLDVPTGSVLKLRLSGPASGFSLQLGDTEHALKRIDDRNAEIDLTLDESVGEKPQLTLMRRSKSFAEWPLRILPDTPPQIAFAATPKTDRRGNLEVEMKAEDDYGVQQVQVEMNRQDAEEPVSFDWPAPPAAAGAITDKQSFDLTAHPWAGLEVQMTLSATDAIGQTGRSEAVTVTLPARRFTNPAAKAIVEQRRELALRPSQWQRVSQALKALTLAPELYHEDFTAHLGIRMAAVRLALDRRPDSIASVQQLLWETALRIEDGKRSQAEKNFQSAMDRLQDAIDRNADDEEIQKLMNDLRQAMNDLLDQRMREALERLAQGEQPEELDDNEQALSSEDFQDMMDRAEDMARMGDRDAARQMLEEMRQMLDALKNGKLARMPEGRGRQGQRGQMPGSQMMQEFGEMMRKQQQLLDRSFRRSQQYGRGGQQPRSENEGDARAQEELRRQLGEMMGRMAENGMPLPDQLGRADRSMRDARDALRQGDPGEAMRGQNDALDQMRQGMEELRQAQRGNPNGQAPSADARQNRRNPDRDPFGRNLGGYEDNARGDAVPEIGPVERARRILEELQRRAGQRERNPDELDYLNRLLRRF
ncbi:MAG TPA: TIGR02302 family protein [Ferrovibrio sp.]|uniref:TIGR02302 family protein n=1 Tax=Ferrovibrio sp. TaxID=1917215 RepID=UPI002ED3A7A7